MSSNKHSINVFTTMHPTCARSVEFSAVTLKDGAHQYVVCISERGSTSQGDFVDTVAIAMHLKSATQITVTFAKPKLLSARLYAGSIAFAIALDGQLFKQVVVIPHGRVNYIASDNRVQLGDCAVKVYGESGKELAVIPRQTILFYNDGRVEFAEHPPIPAML